MIKFLRAITLISLLAFPGLYLYGKNCTHHINTREYMNESNFYQIPTELFEDEYFPDGLDKVFSDDSITDLESLVNASKHVLLVETTSELIYSGNGVLREVKIEDVIKSPTLKKDDFIKVYEPIQNWSMSATNYLGSSTPLKNNSKYYIFINEAPNPNIEGTYLFSTLTYGHFNIDNQFSCLELDAMVTSQKDTHISIKEASNYEYIGVNKEEQELYKRIKKEINDAGWIEKQA